MVKFFEMAGACVPQIVFGVMVVVFVVAAKFAPKEVCEVKPMSRAEMMGVCYA